MPIDFSFSQEVEDARLMMRGFLQDTVKPAFAALQADKDAQRADWSALVKSLRQKAKAQGFWLPHMPQDVGGMGLGVTALAAVSAEAAKIPMGPYIINAQAPDEGNMHTLYHFATDYQREHFLKPLLEGTARSCFSMTEPDVAGSDPTLIQTSAVEEGDEWVINGHKWFTSGAEGADFAIVIARTDPDAEIPQARNSAFIVPTNTPGFEIIRDVETMGGAPQSSRNKIYRCASTENAPFG
ncbi:acyl-CoA dehydrogenase family protein [Pseudomonadales bacterium]|nr:acyl-CoA dehydrogenase family protein [Pseudomonadales bacterium]